jgi:hypothetical protein
LQCDDKVVIDEEKMLLTHVNGAEIVMNKKYKIVLPVVLGMSFLSWLIIGSHCSGEK